MTRLTDLRDEDSDKPVRCGDCGWTGKERETLPIRDLEQRVAPGEETPVGECPQDDCGSLCHYTSEEPGELYAIDIQICATAYIRASSPAAAEKIARGLKGDTPIIKAQEGDIVVTDLPFSDSDMPPISMSPSMTIRGLWPRARARVAG